MVWLGGYWLLCYRELNCGVVVVVVVVVVVGSCCCPSRNGFVWQICRGGIDTIWCDVGVVVVVDWWLWLLSMGSQVGFSIRWMWTDLSWSKCGARGGGERAGWGKVWSVRIRLDYAPNRGRINYHYQNIIIPYGRDVLMDSRWVPWWICRWKGRKTGWGVNNALWPSHNSSPLTRTVLPMEDDIIIKVIHDMGKCGWSCARCWRQRWD